MKTKLDVISPSGELLEERTLINAPWKALYPEQDMVIIDWMADTTDRPNAEQIMTPVEYKDKIFYGDKYWGSAVKIGKTIGVTEPFLDNILVKRAEDGQRVGRYLHAEGHWGMYQGPLRVRISPINTMTPWGVIHDGRGFIRKNLAEENKTKLSPINAGRARESYMFWQRIPWSDELENEIKPILLKQCEDAADIGALLMQYSPASFEHKRKLYQANKKMERHPFIVNAIARSSGDILARMATTANVGTKWGLIIPTQEICIPWLPDGHPVIIYRHPIDSYGSIQAVVNSLKDLKHMNYVTDQYTLADKRLVAKGLVSEVETNEFDLWICNEDIKMSTGDLEEMRAQDETITDNSVLSFTQKHKAENNVGVPIDWGKEKIGCDADGDTLDVVDGAKYPALYEAVLSQPDGKTPKLTKTSSPLSDRPFMIRKSMMNLVGHATKVASDTFIVEDRQTLAKELGKKTRALMDEELNYNVKCGTDGYKCNIDMEVIRKNISVMSSNQQNLLGKGAVYTDWPNEEDFSHSIPKIWSEDLTDDEKARAIMPWMDGTVPKICKITLPFMQNALDEPFAVYPLTEFRGFVPRPVGAILEEAKRLQKWYNARAVSTNWMDDDDIKRTVARWNEEIAKSNFDRMELAKALWYVAHSARGTYNGAGSVFLGFEEETVLISEIGANPKKVQAKQYIVVNGLDQQVPKTDQLEIEGEIKDMETIKDGRVLIRKVIVAEVPGQRQPKDKRWPFNAIAIVAKNTFQPPVGKFKIRLMRGTENTHLMTLD